MKRALPMLLLLSALSAGGAMGQTIINVNTTAALTAAVVTINAAAPGSSFVVNISPGSYSIAAAITINANRTAVFRGQQADISPNACPRNCSFNPANETIFTRAAANLFFDLTGTPAANVEINGIAFSTAVQGRYISAASALGSDLMIKCCYFFGAIGNNLAQPNVDIATLNSFTFFDNRYEQLTPGLNDVQLVRADDCRNVLVRQNTVIGDLTAPVKTGIAFQVRRTLTNATIWYNTIMGVRNAAIDVLGNPGDFIDAQVNAVSNIMGNGLVFTDFSNGKVVNNDVSNLTIMTGNATGIMLTSCMNADVSMNSVKDTDLSGIAIQDASATGPSMNVMVSMNDVMNANRTSAPINGGIFLHSHTLNNTAKKIYVYRNNIWNNRVAGVILGDRPALPYSIFGKDFRVYENIFMNNDAGLMTMLQTVGPVGQIDATGNWWGGGANGPLDDDNPLPPSGAQSVMEDPSQTDVVLYSPWLGGATNPDDDMTTRGYQDATPKTYYVSELFRNGNVFNETGAALTPANPAAMLVPSMTIGGVRGMLNKAVSYAKSGDMIVAWPGAYKENVTVPMNKGTLTFHSTNTGMDPRMGTRMTNLGLLNNNNFYPGEAAVVQTTAMGTEGAAGFNVMSGNTVEIDGYTLQSWGAQALMADASTFMLKYSVVESWNMTQNTNAMGVASVNASPSLMVSDNLFRNIRGTSVSAATALNVMMTTTAQIMHNSFDGRMFTFGAGMVMPMAGSSVMGMGLRLQQTTGATTNAIQVDWNEIMWAMQTGLSISDNATTPARNIRVRWNEIYGNNTSNTLNQAGVMLTIVNNGSRNMLFERNNIRLNMQNGVQIIGNISGDNVDFNYNLIHGNTNGLSYSGIGLDAAGNWWGSAYGPKNSTNVDNAVMPLQTPNQRDFMTMADATGLSTQQTIVGNTVSYSPWLGARADDLDPTMRTAPFDVAGFNGTISPDDTPYMPYMWQTFGYQDMSAKAYFIGVVSPLSTSGGAKTNTIGLTVGYVQRANDFAKDGDWVYFHDDNYSASTPTESVTVDKDLIFATPLPQSQFVDLIVINGKTVQMRSDFQVRAVRLAGSLGDGTVVTYPLPPMPPFDPMLPPATNLGQVKTLTFTGSVTEGANNRYVKGNLRTTRSVLNVANTFGNMGFRLTPLAGAVSLGAWTVTRTAGVDFPSDPMINYVLPPLMLGSEMGIDRVWKVQYTGSDPGMNWQMNLSWLSDDDPNMNSYPQMMSVRNEPMYNCPTMGGCMWNGYQTTPMTTVANTSPRTFDNIPLSNANFFGKGGLFTVVNGCNTMANAGPDMSVCNNQMTQLMGTPMAANLTYNWAPATGLNNPTIANPMLDASMLPLGTHTFTFTVVEQNDCFASDQITITVTAPPMAMFPTDPMNACVNMPATMPVMLTGTAPFMVEYSINGVMQPPFNCPTMNCGLPLNTVSNGSFSYQLTKITDAVCMNDMNMPLPSALALVHIPPTASLNTATTTLPPVCLGGTSMIPLNLSGTGPWTIGFSENGSPAQFVMTAVSPYMLTVTPSAVGMRTFTITSVMDASTCMASSLPSAVMVNVLAPIGATLSSAQQNATICPGQGVMLTVNFTGAGPWTLTLMENGAMIQTFANITASPFMTTVTPTGGGMRLFTLGSVTNGVCTTGSISGGVMVNVAAPATAVISGSASIQTGQTATLMVALTGMAPWTIQYAENNGPVTTVTGIMTSPFMLTVTPTGTGVRTYTLVSVSDANNGFCGTGLVTGQGLVTVTAPPPCATATLLSATPSTIVLGQSSLLSVSLTGVAPWTIQYQENQLTPITVSGILSSPFTFPVTPTGSGQRNYTLVSVNGAGCFNGSVSGLMSITVNPTGCGTPPTATLNGNPGTITLGQTASFTVALTGSSPWTLTYKENSNTPITVSGITASPFTLLVTPTGTGTRTYTLVSLSDAVCTAGNVSGVRTVVVNPVTGGCTLPSAFTINGGVGNVVACGTVSLTPDVTNSASYTYQWKRNGVAFASGRTITVSSTGAYTVTVSEPGCPSVTSATLNVTILTMPTLTLTKTDATTSTSSDGSITASASTSSSVTFEYGLAGPVSRPFQLAQMFSSLPAGTYTVTARVLGASGCDVSQTITIGTQPLGAPTIISITSITTGQGRVNWTSVAGATGYVLEYRVLGATTWQSVTGITATFFTLTGLQSGTTYQVRVRASNVGSPFSSIATFTTTSVAESCLRPTGVFAEPQTATTALLTWTPSVGVACYDVEYRIGNGAFVLLLPRPSGASGSVTITGLLPNTNYQVRMRSNCVNCPASLSNQLSSYTSSISFVTPASREEGASDVAATIPTRLYPNPNNGRFTLSFDANESGEAKLQIESVTGARVYQANQNVMTGPNEWTVEPANLAQGVYFVRLEIDGRLQTLKFVVR